VTPLRAERDVVQPVHSGWDHLQRPRVRPLAAQVPQPNRAVAGPGGEQPP
jgi:hypothetical protein